MTGLTPVLYTNLLFTDNLARFDFQLWQIMDNTKGLISIYGISCIYFLHLYSTCERWYEHGPHDTNPYVLL